MLKVGAGVRPALSWVPDCGVVRVRLVNKTYEYYNLNTHYEVVAGANLITPPVRLRDLRGTMTGPLSAVDSLTPGFQYVLVVQRGSSANAPMGSDSMSFTASR